MECEILVNEMQLEHMSQFKYLGCVLDESVMDVAEFYMNVASGRKSEFFIRSWVNVRGSIVLGSCMIHCSCLFLCMVKRQ